MIAVILKCRPDSYRDCNSENLVKAGLQSGHQRVKCKDCGKKYQLDYTYEANKPGVREKIEVMAHNGSGVRDTARVLGINKNTVINNLKKKADQVEYVIPIAIGTDLVKQLPDEEEKNALNKLEIDICISAECDEQWSYVENKKNKRWLWYILTKGSKRVLAFIPDSYRAMSFKDI